MTEPNNLEAENAGAAADNATTDQQANPQTGSPAPDSEEGTLNAEAEEEMMRRLRALGYVE